MIAWFGSLLIIVALLPTFLCREVIAQEETGNPVNYLKLHQAELKVTDSHLDGPAAIWLRDEARKAQFFFLGEEHDTREIPIIATALWKELFPLGYRHVAIEAGPWLGGRLDRFARFADYNALTQFKSGALPRRSNVSVPPSSDEDLEFYKTVGQTGTYRLPLIWGIDYEYKVTPLLTRLLDLDPKLTLQYRLRTILSKIAEAERAGSYNLQPFRLEIERIANAIPEMPGSEATQIRNALRDLISGDEVKKREFLGNYRASQAAGEQHPRVLLRFGSYHAKRGLMSEFGTSTLANFVGELATAERSSLFNAIFIDCDLDSKDDWRAPKGHPRPCSPRERTWLRPFVDAAKYQWTMFELRDMRKEIRAGRMNVNRELWEITFGFDAVVLMKQSGPSHFLH